MQGAVAAAPPGHPPGIRIQQHRGIRGAQLARAAAAALGIGVIPQILQQAGGVAERAIGPGVDIGIQMAEADTIHRIRTPAIAAAIAGQVAAYQ